jgi:hypothetical protein
MIERNLLDQTKDLRGPQRLVQSNFGMEVGGMQRQNDAQPIQDRNNRHFDVSGPIRAGGSEYGYAS